MSADNSQEENSNSEDTQQSLHLNLRAGKDVGVNIGIDSPAPEKKSEDKGQGGDNKDNKEQDKDSKEKDDKNKKEKPSPLKNPKVKIILIICLVVLLIGFLCWLYYYWTYDRYQQETNDAYLKVDQITVSPQTSGYVTQVLVADNQQVKAGDVLVKIDPLPYEAKLSQAEAQIDAANADIMRYQAQIRQQEAQIEQAYAELAGARSNLRFFTDEVARYRPLVDSGAETKEKFDQMENSLHEAAAQENADVAQASSAERMIDTLKAQVAQARAQLELAKAQTMQARIDLDYTSVHASFDGRIGNKTVRTGQYMQPGSRMMSLIPLQEIYCEANYKETQIGLMRVGQPVKISVDTLPQVEIRGEVESFSPGTGAEFSLLPPENATGNFTKIVQRIPVRIRLITDDDTRAILVPGLSVETTVDTLSEKHFVDHAKKLNKRLDKTVDKQQNKIEKQKEREDKHDETP